MATNNLICTTNMNLSHYMHRLWGSQKRKVLNSILHCNLEIFISPGNSSAKSVPTVSHCTVGPLNRGGCSSWQLLGEPTKPGRWVESVTPKLWKNTFCAVSHIYQSRDADKQAFQVSSLHSFQCGFDTFCHHNKLSSIHHLPFLRQPSILGLPHSLLDLQSLLCPALQVFLHSRYVFFFN